MFDIQEHIGTMHFFLLQMFSFSFQRGTYNGFSKRFNVFLTIPTYTTIYINIFKCKKTLSQAITPAELDEHSTGSWSDHIGHKDHSFVQNESSFLA